jgi:ACT domain-containing protein
MEQPQSRRPRRTSLEIKQLLEDFKLSSINAKEFCKTRGVSEGAFYKWRSRYELKSTAKQNTFVKLKVSSPLAPESGLFAEVNGIRIYQPVTALYLKELLA